MSHASRVASQLNLALITVHLLLFYNSKCLLFVNLSGMVAECTIQHCRMVRLATNLA